MITKSFCQKVASWRVFYTDKYKYEAEYDPKEHCIRIFRITLTKDWTDELFAQGVEVARYDAGIGWIIRG